MADLSDDDLDRLWRAPMSADWEHREFARAVIAEDRALNAPQAAPVGEPALWQFRWTNPGNYPDSDEDAIEWREVKVSNPHMQTMDDRLAELRSFTFNGKPCYEVRALYPQAAPVAPAEPAPPGWQLVPVDPTHAMVSAMAGSRARDDEGEYPSLSDLIDYSGENKTHTVLKAAYRAMLAAAPHPATAGTTDAGGV